MMDVAVLGATGMVGSMLYTQLREVFLVTGYASNPWRSPHGRSVEKFDAWDQDFDLLRVAEEHRYVVNCIGVTVRKARRNICDTIYLNAAFPHRLADICLKAGSQLIHVSTDGVFSGRVGSYVESDKPDADDIYGATKIMGEPSRGLTIRTSFVGPELPSAPPMGLLEWFLASEPGRQISGQADRYWNGVTTLEFARLLASFVAQGLRAEGVRHVFSDGVSKFQLLTMIRAVFGLNADIVEVHGKEPMDLSLDTEHPAFMERLGGVKRLRDQIEEMKAWMDSRTC